MGRSAVAVRTAPAVVADTRATGAGSAGRNTEAIAAVLTPHANGLRVRLKVTPRARESRVDGLAVGADGPCLAVRVTAVPENGRANAAVLSLLADEWDLPRSDLDVVIGGTSRSKVVAVAGDHSRLYERLERWAERCGLNKSA